MALGLPDFETQVKLMRRFLQNPLQIYNDADLLVDTCTYIGQRLSEKTIDAKMVELLQLLYKDEYDGYIQPIKVASCWMNEFAEEICIFNMKKLSNITLVGGKKHKVKYQSGGSLADEVWNHKMNDTMYDEHYFTRNKIYRKIFLKYDGYTDDEIDNFEKIGMPPFNERIKHRRTHKSVIDIPNDLEDIPKIHIKTDNRILLKQN